MTSEPRREATFPMPADGGDAGDGPLVATGLGDDSDTLGTALWTLYHGYLTEAQEGVPARRQAWLQAAQHLRRVLDTFAVPDRAAPETEHMTHEQRREHVQQLVEEAVLSPGPVTPATQAMRALLAWMLEAGKLEGDSAEAALTARICEALDREQERSTRSA